MIEHNNIRPWCAACATVIFLTVAGCGDVEVKAEPKLPTALISQLPLTVGVFYGSNFRSYIHREDRWGSGYVVDLGAGHINLADRLFQLEFKRTVPVENLNAAPTDPELAAIVEPRIERYSFLTARDTGGKYFAVTIDYRLNLFNVHGERIDSFTFVGYGSAPSKGIASKTPLYAATQAAMRDAAAKFLVQFPEQATVKKLLNGETVAPLGIATTAESGTGPAAETIELVPLVEKAVETTAEKKTDPLQGTQML
jgi:hypothetical protein